MVRNVIEKILPTLIVMVLAGAAATFISFKISEHKIGTIEKELNKKVSSGAFEMTRTMHENRMGTIEKEVDRKANQETVLMMYDDIREIKKDIKELLREGS